MQADRQDDSAVGWDHHEKVDKHASQKGTKMIQCIIINTDHCPKIFSCLIVLNIWIIIWKEWSNHYLTFIIFISIYEC